MMFADDIAGQRSKLELERVTHFKCLGTSTEEEFCMATEITVRMGPGWRKFKKCRGVLCAGGAYETDHTGNAIYVGYNEATRK